MLIATEGGGLKSRAFTLIELLAVIIIIGVIALIATPVIIGVISKTERQAFERSIDGLLETVRLDYSTDDFVSPREYYYEGKDLILLTVAEETKDENVGIKGKIEGKGFIYIDVEGIIHIENICSKKYCANGEENQIEIIENESGIIPEVGKNDPIIRLIGEKTIYVNLNENYEELGAVAKTKSGKVLDYMKEITITSSGEIISNIDTSVEDTYMITYKTENVGKEVSVTRTVVVLEMKPEITMTEPDEAAVTSKEVLITVSGKRPNQVNGFTYTIKVNGEVVSTKTETVRSKTIFLESDGVNEVSVTVTDDHGHTNTMTKTYRIDQTGPVITIDPKEVTLESERVQDYDILTGVSVRDEVEGEIEKSRIEIGGDPLLKIPGRYEVTYTVRDNLGNETTGTRVFIVEDKTKPEIVITPDGTTTYVKSQVVTIEASDNIRVDEIKYVIIKNNVRGVEQTISNGGSITLNETGEYQIEVTAKDSSNNTSSKISKTYGIDAVTPTLTITTSSYRGQYGTDKALSTFYQATFGEMKGQVVCKNGTTPIDKVSDITQAGEYSISCQAIGNNGKSSDVKTIAMTITPKEFAEVMTGSDIAANDPDNNKRYVGANPNNYVRFNNELWRIIGLFNGEPKIIKETSIGNKAWDTNNKNNWETATLKNELNGTYLDSIDITSKSYINEVHVWSLGGSTGNKTREGFYNDERGTNKYGENATDWTGAIGLMYASDYGYATSATDSTCTTGAIQGWKGSVVSCRNNDWLLYKDNEWLLNSRIDNSFNAYYVLVSGGIEYWNEWTTTRTQAVRPTVYLNTNVKIMGGTGTSDDPYVLGYGLYNENCTKVTRTVMGKQVTSCMLENDPDHNLRYVGSNPNNYVKFNNELWRIIGVFENKTKLIRANAVARKAWDENNKNNWETATLQKYLNNEYYPKIEIISRNYIENDYIWKLGGLENGQYKRSDVYNYERSSNVLPGNSQTWKAPVGLMYPSDYAYASSGGTSCDTGILYQWHRECIINSWLYFPVNYQWTLTHLTSTNNVLYIHNGSLEYWNELFTSKLGNVKPVLYLKSTIKIKSGSGTAQDPYLLGT